MEDYTREMMDLKSLVTRTLEKKGVLAKIRAELRASVFEAIEEEDRVTQSNEGLPPALLGNCNDRARRLHASPSGRLLSSLVCEYLGWAQLNHTLKVFQPECNLPKDSWKSELRDFSSNSGYELNRNGDTKPLLLDVLEGFFNFEAIGGGSSRRESETESSSSLDSRNPPQRRFISASQTSGPTSGYRKDEHSWRYESEDGTEEVMRASAALENLQLDRKTRNLTSFWRSSGVVFTNPMTLVDMLMDSVKSAEIFPSVVAASKTLAVVSSGLRGNQGDALHLMLEELQVLSPLVPTREFSVLRYCQQIEHGTWAVENVSYELPQFMSSSRSYRFPSGCLIQDVSNGYSKVTWVEHVEISEQEQVHEMFKDHISEGLALLC